MSSCGNEVSNWSFRHIRRIAEPLESVNLPSYTHRFSLEKPVNGIEQCLHLPGKADSAYSSFSGGSNIPECPISSCCNEGDSLPLEHLPYMDSGYIRGVYNPIAINSDFRQMHDNKTVEMSGHTELDSPSYSRLYGSTPTHEMLVQPPSPVARLLPPFPHPPSLPPQTDCYNISTNVKQTNSGIHSLHTEQYSYEDLPFGSLANCYDNGWLTNCKNESPIAEEHGIWYAANRYTTTKSNSPVVTKPCLMFQEFLTSGSLAKTQKLLCTQNSVHTYKIPEEIKSKSSPSLHVSHNAVNDTQENKQCFYACSVHKPPVTVAELPSTKEVPSKPKGQLNRDLHLLEVNEDSDLDQNRCESCLSLKYTESSPPNEAAALGIINSYENRSPCFSSEGETSREVWQLLLKQQTRMQKPPIPDLDVEETPHCEIYDTANTTSYYKHLENSGSQMLDGFTKAKQNNNNHSPELLTNPGQEEKLKPIHFPKQKCSKKALGQSQDDSASIKINRKTTPLLYYLSGGKNTSVVSHRNPAQEQENSAIKSSRSNHPVSTEPIEIPRDSNNCVNDTANKNEGLILGSPASSVDEKFKNDYREKLKVAQRKVLRETSFKRKDLQMSLPIRLKQKPSPRPSIQHLRSLSLSSTNEDSKLVPPPKPLETINKEEESRRPQTIRIGGRKRANKEQKKFSYSEPEKLNQLDDPKEQSVSWTKQNARSRSDEINEDTRIIRSKALENQDRAFSKVELKQIQHKALLEYMERKIGQRPATTQSSTQQKPTLQSRPLSSKKSLEDNLASNLATSRRLQHIDGFCQFPAPGKILEYSAFPSTLTSTVAVTSIPGRRSPVSETADSKVQPSVCEENWVSKNALTKSVLQSGGFLFSKIRGRSKSTPAPMQDIYQSIACPVFSSEDHENYHKNVSSASKEDMEVGLLDQKVSPGPSRQSSYTAGRRGASMDETGASEITRLSPFSQSTDQLHHLKSWRIYSGQETGKSSQGTKDCNPLQNCEPKLGRLPRQSHLKGSVESRHLTVQALDQDHSTNKLSSSLFSVDNPLPYQDPHLSRGKFPNVPLEFLHSSPASSPETDNDVFKDSSTSGSELASHISSSYRQSKNSTPDRKTPEPALTGSTLQASTEREQFIKEYSTSIHFLETEECSVRNGHGESGEQNNSHCLKMAAELPIFFSEERSNKDSQLRKESSEQSQVSNASERTQQQQQQQQLEGTDIIHPLDNRIYHLTSQIDSLFEAGGNSNIDPLVNATTLQKEHDHRFPVQDTTLSISQSKSPEDQRREDLAIEIVAKDRSLVDILMPHQVRKTALDLMEGLFPASISMLNKSCRKKGRVSNNGQRSRHGETDPSQETNINLGQRAEGATFHVNHILTKSLDDPDSITSKKKELISSINLKLQTLWDERELIQSEVKEHAMHGKEIESVVQELCKPNEYERYMMFIGDLEKVVNLLLCLSSRLARVQNAMEKTDENTDAEEKQSLNERHRLLSRQQEDAKDLKENLDRRERVVSDILSKYITEIQLQDFRHFVQAKISLLIEQKHLEEQIKFLEEQLERLEKSIPP